MKYQKKLLKYFIKALQCYEINYNKLIKGNYSDDLIHDIRVDTRKINSAIDLLIYLSRAKSDKINLKQIKQELKNFMKSLSVTRDIEVQIKLSNELLKAIPHEINFEIKRYKEIMIKLENENNAEYKIFLLEQSKFKYILQTLEKYLYNLKFKNKVLIKKINRYEKIYKKDLYHSTRITKTNNANFHSTRVKIKKYRYFLEIKNSYLNGNSKKTSKKIKKLKILQDKLGNCNDLNIMLNNFQTFSISKACYDYVLNIYTCNLNKSLHFLFDLKTEQ